MKQFQQILLKLLVKNRPVYYLIIISGIFSCLVLLKHIIDVFKPNVIKEGVIGSAPQTQFNATLPAINLPKFKLPKLNGDLSKYEIQDIKLDDRFKLIQDNPQNNTKLLDNSQDKPSDKSSKYIDKRVDRKSETPNDNLADIIIKIFNKGEIEITK